MKFFNCSIGEALERLGRKRIVFFGSGSYLISLFYSELFRLKDNFAYIVDNNPGGNFHFNRKELPVFHPDKLKGDSGCVIILTSPIYMYDMYMQLVGMNLDDSFTCYAFPFMQQVSDKEPDPDLVREVTSCNKPVIPKIIHSFWFSGEEKPESYQRCLDTWSKVLTDYEIIEWNQENYDCSKHPFVKRAIEEKAWAFASDYTRLDVLSQYGGIYLDMDVELFKPFDDLLGNETIFAYSNNIQIDCAVLGSKKDNPIIKKMLALYDGVTLPADRTEFSKFFQPAFVKPLLASYGIQMDGSLQQIEGATIFPKQFFMPQDHILFLPYEKTEHTYCNHLDNFGWTYSGKNKREKKIEDNRKLWNILGKAL